MESRYVKLLVVLRILLGFVFFWTFIDKTFGLGFSTPPDQAWLAGVSPTFGYLTLYTQGPAAALMQAIAGNPIVDVLFMMGMLLVGISLMLGIGLQIAGYSGALMMTLIYISHFPPANNLIVDQHIVYSAILIGIALFKPAQVGVGQMWLNTAIVKRYPVLA